MPKSYLCCCTPKTWVKLFAVYEFIYIFFRQMFMVLILTNKFPFLMCEENRHVLQKHFLDDLQFRIINCAIPVLGVVTCSIVLLAENKKNYRWFTPYIFYLCLQLSLSMSSCFRIVFQEWPFPITEITTVMAFTATVYYCLSLHFALVRYREILHVTLQRYESAQRLL